MKLVFDKADLVKSVGIAMKAVSGKTTMPILECILIDASSNVIKFTSNDMELGIETIVTGMILERGIVALDAKIFSEIVRKLPDNQVTIETDENLVTTITCEKAKFNIPGQSGEDFSYLPILETSDCVSISQFTLKELIRQTIFSIAANENNKLMTGELFEIKDNTLRVVSLDGHRIAIRRIELKDSYPARKVFIFSPSFLSNQDFGCHIFSNGYPGIFHIHDEIAVDFRYDCHVSANDEAKIFKKSSGLFFSADFSDCVTFAWICHR